MALWNHRTTNEPDSASLHNYWANNQLPIVTSKVNYYGHWSGTDSEDNFKKNPKSGYTEKSVYYQYNSWGYRTKSFDLQKKRPSIICLGCSFTEGIGVNYLDTWVSKIENYFPEYNVYNMGVSGGSGDTVARLLYNIGDILNTKMVFILWPHMFRHEIYNNDHAINNVTPSSGVFSPEMLTDINFYNIRSKNKAIVSMCQQLYGYTVIQEDVANLQKDKCPIVDRGRDNHPGPKWHNDIAEHFIKKYNDNTTI